MTGYVMLESNLKRQFRNQRAHVLDPDGRTYCQTENVRRTKPFNLVHFKTPPKGVRVCLVCLEVQEEGFSEPSLAKLMGESI